MKVQATLAMIFLGLASGPGQSIEIDSDFASRKETFEKWNDCQAFTRRLKFRSSGGITFMRNDIDGKLKNRETCPTACVKEDVERIDDDLGTSMIFDTSAHPKGDDCPKPEEDAKGKVIHQRNELRPHNDVGGCNAADAGHWYTMKFRVEEDKKDKIPVCGSIRWVLAQWKYAIMRKDTKDLKVNGSPFLAQRFDNGVLHITVEDGFCRCMIAKAEGDPYKKKIMKDQCGKLIEVPALRCEDGDEKVCSPPNLKLFTVDPVSLKQLPDPKKNWVEMTYHVFADAKKGTRFDIYADGRFIVRAQGTRAANIEFPNLIKFKFGHYRDKFQNKASLLVDRVCVSEKQETCGKGICVPP
jgi:hypothetical protein